MAGLQRVRSTEVRMTRDQNVKKLKFTDGCVCEPGLDTEEGRTPEERADSTRPLKFFGGDKGKPAGDAQQPPEVLLREPRREANGDMGEKPERNELEPRKPENEELPSSKSE
ncbi:UNVERIFIED_CONTAM: hypothetical protein FKN15_070252 [Acipenser sinensis]